VSGEGTVASRVVIHRTFNPPEYEVTTPYVSGLIELTGTDGRVSMLSVIVGCEPDQVRIGMPVRVVFDDVAEGVAVPKFQPLNVA
jgi:uncharacterized OB-fold protein